MLSITYREVKSRLSEEQLIRLSEYCAESGLSQSEVIRRAIDLLVRQPPENFRKLTEPTDGSNGPIDPSNPLA